jgi:hypothetical protein
MSKRLDLQEELRSLDKSGMREFLTAHSGLPGPRGNLELLAAFGDVAPIELILGLVGSDDEFLAACAVAALGCASSCAVGRTTTSLWFNVLPLPGSASPGCCPTPRPPRLPSRCVGPRPIPSPDAPCRSGGAGTYVSCDKGSASAGASRSLVTPSGGFRHSLRSRSRPTRTSTGSSGRTGRRYASAGCSTRPVKSLVVSNDRARDVERRRWSPPMVDGTSPRERFILWLETETFTSRYRESDAPRGGGARPGRSPP